MEMPNTLAGGLVAAGGIAGYAKAGSMPSLIGGLVGGGALIGAGALVSTRKFDLEGHVIGMAAQVHARRLGCSRRNSDGVRIIPIALMASVREFSLSASHPVESRRRMYNTQKAKDCYEVCG